MSLADSLQKAYTANLIIDDFNAETLEQISEIASEFNMAPDNMIDVKRLPIEVHDLKSLKSWMEKVRDDLAKLDDKEKKKSPIVTGGTLKLYKHVILCIHCLTNFVRSSDMTTGNSLRDFVAAAFKHGSTNPPEGMGDGGKKAWDAGIVAGSSRVKNVMGAIVIISKPKFTAKQKGIEDNTLHLTSKGLVAENDIGDHVALDEITDENENSNDFFEPEETEAEVKPFAFGNLNIKNGLPDYTGAKKVEPKDEEKGKDEVGPGDEGKDVKASEWRPAETVSGNGKADSERSASDSEPDISDIESDEEEEDESEEDVVDAGKGVTKTFFGNLAMKYASKSK